MGLDSNHETGKGSLNSASSRLNVASLLKPLKVGAGMVPRQDPPSDDHYQPLSGSTAASSGSAITEQGNKKSTPSIISDNQSRPALMRHIL